MSTCRVPLPSQESGLSRRESGCKSRTRYDEGASLQGIVLQHAHVQEIWTQRYERCWLRCKSSRGYCTPRVLVHGLASKAMTARFDSEAVCHRSDSIVRASVSYAERRWCESTRCDDNEVRARSGPSGSDPGHQAGATPATSTMARALGSQTRPTPLSRRVRFSVSLRLSVGVLGQRDSGRTRPGSPLYAHAPPKRA